MYILHMGKKPFGKTVISQASQGTGGLAIEACGIPTTENQQRYPTNTILMSPSVGRFEECGWRKTRKCDAYRVGDPESVRCYGAGLNDWNGAKIGDEGYVSRYFKVI